MRTPEQILRESKTIAVVGVSDSPLRDSHRVARYLRDQGYRVFLVNPNVAEVFGQRCHASLREVPEPIDLVDVFRRPDQVMPIAEDAVAVGARVLWLQDGVINEAAARLAREAGLDVVMDDCTMRRHARMASAGD